MNNQIKISACCTLVLFLFLECSLSAQIKDIKKESGENKNSSGNNSSNSDDIGSSIAEGCFSSLFESLFGCLFSGGNNNNNQYNAQNQNQIPGNNALINADTSNYQYHQYPVSDSVLVQNNENLYPFNNVNANDDVVYPSENKVKEPAEYSLDIKAIVGFGFEFSSDKTYKYINYLPAIRANLSWFALDFRYNMLTEYTDAYTDAFKSWDLTFLLNLKAGDNSKIFLGPGMHYEKFSETNFFEFLAGTKIGLSEKRDYLFIEGRFVTDFNDFNNPDDNSYPFTEVALNYNKRLINTENLNGYISIGAFYQNYYHTADIWAIHLGFILNLHN